MFARLVSFLVTSVLVVASSGCATSVVTETTRLDGTVVRTTTARNIGFLEPLPSYYGGGYAVLAPVYGSSSSYQPIHVPSVKFGRMIRPNVRLVYVDGEARECDVRPGSSGNCWGNPAEFGSAMHMR